MKKLLLFALIAALSCAASLRAVTYEERLRQCNTEAGTRAESIACENGVRLEAGRPLRGDE